MANRIYFHSGLIFILALFVVFPASMSLASAQPRVLYNQDIINNFYLKYDGKPLWLNGGKLNQAGKELWEALNNSWQHGLNPNRYYATEIAYLLSQKGYIDLSDTNLSLKLEVLLTSGYVLYAQDLTGARINADDIGLDSKDWNQSISPYEALSILPHNIENMKGYLDSLGPQTDTYRYLKGELVKLVKQNSDKIISGDSDVYSGEHKNIGFASVLVPGRGDANIPELRERLGITEKTPESRYTYDRQLVEAVKEYQAANGLKADGIIGEQTVNSLNLSYDDKMRRIIINMERLRWVSDEKPSRFVVVNVPSARLWAVDNGKVKLSMSVVVGSEKRPTMSFVTNISGVRFNPTWTIPETIKKEDILPRLQADSRYLADKGIELFEGYGSNAITLDPMAVDWKSITDNGLRALNMVQIPGSHNPLGKIRVLMPNRYDIYLHDTNDKSLFGRNNRAASSGCIRLERPEDLARFILGGMDMWNDKDKIAGVIDGGKTTDIYLDAKDYIKVYLLYYTIWLGEDHRLVYGQDIYGYDDVLWGELMKLDDIPFLGDNGGELSTSLQ